jgi:hypothetical protein
LHLLPSHWNACDAARFFDVTGLKFRQPSPKLIDVKASLFGRNLTGRSGLVAENGNDPNGPEGLILRGLQVKYRTFDKISYVF